MRSWTTRKEGQALRLAKEQLRELAVALRWAVHGLKSWRASPVAQTLQGSL